VAPESLAAPSLTRPAVAADDPLLRRGQWHLEKIKAAAGWRYVKESAMTTATVALLDTGVRLSHQDLRFNLDSTHAYDVAPGYTQYGGLMASKSAKPGKLTSAICGFASGVGGGDVSGRGTRLAGLISAGAANGLGSAGASYNAKVLPIKVYQPYASLAQGRIRSDNDLICRPEALVRAFQYLIKLKRQGYESLKVIVLPMSSREAGLGRTLAPLIKEAKRFGMLTVCAAGDSGSSAKTYPGQNADVLCVSATNAQDSKASYSNHGRQIDLCTPGGERTRALDAPSYQADHLYTQGYGSAEAAALVAGAAAFLWRIAPNLSVNEMKRILLASADDLGPKGKDSYYGRGRLNLHAATVLALNKSKKAKPTLSASLEQKGPAKGGIVLKHGRNLESLLKAGRFKVNYRGYFVSGVLRWNKGNSLKPPKTSVRGRLYHLKFSPAESTAFKPATLAVRLFIK
jgi:subtilisin family serine protease